MARRSFAKCVAMVIHNAMDGFHSKYLSEEKMRENNPIIRNVHIYRVLLWLYGTSFLLSCVLYADTWEYPSAKEYTSLNGNFVVKIEPSPRRFPRQKAPKKAPRAEVFKIENDTKVFLWQTSLINGVAPVKTIISEDGEFIITLDNWHRVGRGDTVVVFYNREGLICTLSLEAIVSSFSQGRKISYSKYFPISVSSHWWRGHSIMLIDGKGDKTKFGIWLHWTKQWHIWTVRDGYEVDYYGKEKEYWDELGRKWALKILKNDQNHNVRNVLTACLYLAHAKNPEDKQILEQKLLSNKFGLNGFTYPIRHAADTSLAVFNNLISWNGIVESSRYFDRRKFNDVKYYYLGKLKVNVILPQVPEKGYPQQLMVLVYSNDVPSTRWQKSAPDYKLGRGFGYLPSKREDKTNIEFELHCVSPGQYWVKAVWDKTPPHKYNLFFLKGSQKWRAIKSPDVELTPSDYTNTQYDTFTVKAGHMSEITVKCDHLVGECEDEFQRP